MARDAACYPIALTSVLLLLTMVIGGCREPSKSNTSHEAVGEPASSEPAEVPFQTGPLRFADVAAASGLNFVHHSGARGDFTYPEILCGGVCLADLDGDDDLDIYLTQGGTIQADRGPDEEIEGGRNALFLNDGTGKFLDVSAASGADHPGYGFGAFAADYDQDSDLDLVVTNLDSLTLLQNRGDATFEDVTSSTPLQDRPGLWMNVVFADLNDDGSLDVYAANYTKWNLDEDVECIAEGGGRDYCNPSNYQGAPDLLLWGSRQGTFEDATDASGIGSRATRSMGVVAFDADQDGDLDIYVANDAEANLLWINQGDGTFKEEALLRGAAVNNAGTPEGSMGIACADIDADGDEDLIMTHIARETHTVYQNDSGYFSDVTSSAGMSGWSRPDTGFGIGLLDLNHDAYLDLFMANGHIGRPKRPRNPARPYAQPDRLAAGEPAGRFTTSAAIGKDADNGPGGVATCSRGAAFGDVDGDGLVDLVVAVKDGPVRLFRNMTETSGEWIAIRPVAAPQTPALLHAVVRVIGIAEPGPGTVRPHASYLGSSEHLVRFGLGGRRAPVDVLVTWANGTHERFDGLAPGRVHEVVRGTGQASEGVKSTQASQIVSREASQPVEPDSTQEAQPDTQSARPSGSLGEFPRLRFEPDGPRNRRVILDMTALTSWCESAGLPAPPELQALDPPTWALVHPAMEAAGRNPNPQTLASLAMFYDGHGVREPAVALYERLLELAPEDARWWQLVGRLHYGHGDHGKAIHRLQRAVELAPDEPAGYARLAEAQLAAGDPAGASSSWKLYLERRPDDALGWVGLARATEELGDDKEALKLAESALQKNPRARPACVVAARVAARLGDAAAAQKFTEQYAALAAADPLTLADKVDLGMRAHARSVDYLRFAGIYWKNNGQFERAYEMAKLLADRRPDEAENWQALTWLASRLNRHQAAVEHAQVALEIDPDFAPGWDLAARNHVAAGRLQKALESADRAIEVDASFHPAYMTRGIALTGLGRFDQAIEPLQRALAAYPTNANGLAAMARCLVETGKRDKAKGFVERLLKTNPDHAWAKQIISEL